MKLFCPKCGGLLTKDAEGHLECVRGQMPLVLELEHRLSECYISQSRRPLDIVFECQGRPHNIGGRWYCPSCGIKAEESTPGDLRCPKCGRSLVEFVHSLIERHRHLDKSGKWI